MAGDGNDVAVITVQVLDSKGRLVPDAENHIRFGIKNGRILGVGNGHPSSHERDVFRPGEAVSRNAFGGYVQVLVTSDRSGKPVELTALSDGLKEDTIIIDITE